jgi:CubicO group peptidase (beta-lactamase class C family)
MNWSRIVSAGFALCLGSVAFASQADAANIDRHTEDLFHRSGLTGLAVAVVHGDATVYARGFGADSNGGTVTSDTLFILGSTSKSFTALGILQLAEAGRIGLDDPAARYLPGFLRNAPPQRGVTVRMLLNQVSGISHEAGDQPVISAGESGTAAIRDFAWSLDAASFDRAPGESYEYSNANYVVLGAIIEAVSGTHYADYVRTRIFLPLGMAHTQASLAPGLARGHKQFFGHNYVSDLPYPEGFVPAGFIISSANDLAKYLSAQLPSSPSARKLGISDAGIALWHKGTVTIDAGGKSHYAMGWATDTFNGVPVIWHSADTGVFSSEFTLEPKGRWGVVVLANGSGWLAQDYLQELSSGIVNMEVGRTPRDDTAIHRVVLAIYFAVLAMPLLQLLALWLMRKRKAGWFGRTWPVILHAIVAAGLLVALPRMVFGIPCAELLTSFSDMGLAAILSGVLAVVALAKALRRNAADHAGFG